MKKSKKTALTAAIFATALNMSACTPPDTAIQTEYGAPIAVPNEQETPAPDTKTPEIPETEETYNPEEEMPMEVYGPPKFLEDTTEENLEEETEEQPSMNDEEQTTPPEETTQEYHPQVDRPVLVYGPPETFGGE